MSTTAPFRDAVTHRPLPVSHRSARTVVKALWAALDAGCITEEEYRMTYAEVCEIGREPQAFGGGASDSERMARWQDERGWWQW